MEWPPVPARTIRSDAPLSLAFAVIGSSKTPLLLLGEHLVVVAASASFCSAFRLDEDRVVGRRLDEIGTGEWKLPQLRSLLDATASGASPIEAYEMDLNVSRHGLRKLVLNAHLLAYDNLAAVRILLGVADVTDARASEELKDNLLREKAVLLQELQHRVANSLQIIASVILQSARKVNSEESRVHLRDAHSRVMSVAAMQRQLTSSTLGEVKLAPYFTQLCQSIGASMIRDHDQLSITSRVDDTSTSADVSVSLGLIVTELVINALKHAFPDGRRGLITVSYDSHGSGWTLAVHDDGVGMPSDAASATPGLGTSIVEALARQLKAQVQVTAGHPGTTVRIVHAQPALADSEADIAQGTAV